MPLRILAVGDSYMPVTTFASAFAGLESDHDISYVQVDESTSFSPASASELRVREYAGSPQQVAASMADVEVLVVHGAPVTDAVVAASDRLALVGCARGGPVNVDRDALAARRVALVNTPGKNANAVADQTLAFVIMLSRRLPKACAFLQDGNTVGESTFEGVEFFGHDLGGHVLGLVGYGQVGSRVAMRAQAFGMRVRAFDPHVTIPPQDGVEQVDDLDELLRGADFVSLHARAGAEDRPLIGAAELALLKEGACFINTARESLVDESALDEALASGRLGGAALDVLHRSSATGRHPLLRHENVVLTPHIGGATHETLLRGAEMLAQDVERFAAGRPLLHQIEPAVQAR